MASARQPRAFVMMPFDEEFDDIYRLVITPPLERAGYLVSRADSALDQRNIMRNVVAGIDDADIIVADLTGLNANVLYELGIAHGLVKPVVMLTQDIESLPFDLRAYRVLAYSTDFRRINVFSESLEELARSHISGDVQFGSPVTDFAASVRGSEVPSLPLDLGPASVGAETSSTVAPAAEGNEGLEVLDYSARLEEATDQLERISEDWATSIHVFGQKISVASDQLNVLSESNVPGKSARVLHLTRQVAHEMHEHAAELRNELPAFKEVWAKAMEAVSGLLTTTDYSEPQAVEQLQESTNSFTELESTMSETMQGLGEFRDSVAGLPPMSRDLTKASRDLRRALDEILTELDLGRANVGRVRSLMQQRIAELQEPDQPSQSSE
jgi:Nucleoside 2-deoxyribosyltransferase